MRRIYIAGKFTAKARLYPHAMTILGQGHRVMSSWIFAPAAEGRITPGHVKEVTRDVEEVQASDLLILDTLDESNTGGREVEFGIALGMPMDVWRIGPARSEFHLLADRAFQGWTQVIAATKKEAVL